MTATRAAVVLVAGRPVHGTAAKDDIDEGLKYWNTACDDDSTGLNTFTMLECEGARNIGYTYTVQITRSEVFHEKSAVAKEGSRVHL